MSDPQEIIDKLLSLCETAEGLLTGICSGVIDVKDSVWLSAANRLCDDWENFIEDYPDQYIKPITPSSEFLQSIGLLSGDHLDGFDFKYPEPVEIPKEAIVPGSGSKLFQIYEDDLSELEKSLPVLSDAVAPMNNGRLKTHLRKLKLIVSNIRWNYGPYDEMEQVE